MFESEWRTRFDAVFVQDQWTLNRLTLQGGLRYDHAWSYYPSARIGGTRFFPQVTTIDRADGVDFHNLSPRVGAAYDLFGTGKTSAQGQLGPVSLPGAERRDLHGRGPDVADRDPRRPKLERREQKLHSRLQSVESCRTGSSFERRRFVRRRRQHELRDAERRPQLRRRAAQRSPSLGHADRRGASARNPPAYLGGSAVQQAVVVRAVCDPQSGGECLGLHADTASPRRSIRGSRTAAATPSRDSTTSRLNSSGSSTIRCNRRATTASMRHHWNGFDVTVSARTLNGLTLQLGTSTGQTVMDFCEVAEKVPESLVPPQTVTIGVSIPGAQRAGGQPVRRDALQVLSPGIRIPHAASRAWFVSRAEDRRGGQHDVPEQPGSAAGGQLQRPGGRRGAIARPCRRPAASRTSRSI